MGMCVCGVYTNREYVVYGILCYERVQYEVPWEG